MIGGAKRTTIGNMSTPSKTVISQRDFLKATTVAAVGAATSSLTTSLFAGDEPPAAGKTVAIQIGAVSFVDEGTEKVLDILQEQGAVNTLLIATFSYDRGTAGRTTGNQFPDHGVQAKDVNFHGGNYAMPHPEFYRDTVLNSTRATDFGNLDILEEVLPKAKKRGMKVWCGCIDNGWSDATPGVSQCEQVDLYGRKAGGLCLANPNVRQFWTALATDYCKSYDVDGVAIFNERNGPLLNALGASHLTGIDSSRTTCFCEYHKKAAGEAGLSFERVREGYQRLDEYVKAAQAGQRPTDGYFVEFWRLLTEYPEIVVWNKLFDTGKYQILKDVHGAVKGVRSDLQVGFHIEHVNSFNPIFRAAYRYENLATMADFLKPVVYNNCGGERYATFIKHIQTTVFRDVPLDELLAFNNHLLNYEHESGLEQLAKTGLSPDYVQRETRRAVTSVAGKTKVYPGIDIGIPAGRQASPDDTYAAVTAALKGGADGLILSRKYSEMHLANLAAAGRAVREFKG